jgi:hypothetical protein
MKFRAAFVTSAIVAAAAGALSAAPAMAATTKTASSGSVKAQLSYSSYNKTTDLYSGLRLTITRGGVQALNEAVTGPVCGKYCGPLIGENPVVVTKLDGTSEPNVLIKLYSGGAHCCEIDEAFTYDPGTMTYTRAVYDFADYGEAIKRVSGTYVFESENDAFAYAFTDFAASGAPIEFLTLKGGKFVNVTRNYPALIAKDAGAWLKAYNEQAPQYGDTTGLIAAWAADEDELGLSTKVATFLNAQAAAGHLNPGISQEPKGKKFVTALDRFLRKQGYLK